MPIDRDSSHVTEEDLHALWDGELPPAEAVLLRAHLNACSDCRGRADELDGVFRALQSLPEAALLRDLAPRVLEAIPAQRKRARSRWPWVLALQTMSAAALVSVLGWPSVQAWATRASLSLQFPSTWWMELLASPRGDWDVLLTQVRSLLDVGPNLLSQTPTIPLLAAGPAVLGGLIALWLAGNGLLLIPRRRRTGAG